MKNDGKQNDYYSFCKENYFLAVSLTGTSLKHNKKCTRNKSNAFYLFTPK
jgi:hypothetical protein